MTVYFKSHKRLFWLIIFIVLVCSLLQLWRKSQILSDAEIQQLSDWLRDHYQPSDQIWFHPSYVGEFKQHLGDLTWALNQHANPMSWQSNQRIHFVQFKSIDHSQMPQLLEQAKSSIVVEKIFDKWVWQLYTLPIARPLVFDLYQDIQRVKVRAFYADGANQDCTNFDQDRWICPRDSEWNYVGREIYAIGDEPRRCVWLHPLRANAELLVEIPVNSKTAQLKFNGGFGFTDACIGRVQASVKVHLSLDKELIYSYQHPPLKGWRDFEFSFTPLIQNKLATSVLRISIRTSNNGASHFCMALRVTENTL